MRKYFMTLLSYDAETGYFCWLVNRRGRLGLKAGSITKGRRYIEIDGKSYLAHRLAWLFVYGKWPVGDLDHANGFPDDNRIVNLRLATRSQNVANSKLRRDNNSGVKGVSWYPRTNRWKVQFRKNGSIFYAGYFKNKKVAAQTYRRLLKETHPHFARFQ